MTFDFSGYDLHFIQKERSQDDSAHRFTYIYKFYSPVTRYIYILRAEYHIENVFAIKFYCKKDKGNEYKYSKIINKGDIGNILITCAKVIPLLLQEFPTASFGFIGARTLDKTSRKVESYINNQRFRVYKNVIAKKFGSITFEHIEYSEVSGYLLINRSSSHNLLNKENAIKSMFTGKPALVTKETAATAMATATFDNSKLMQFLPGFKYYPIMETIAYSCRSLQQKLNNQ